MSVFFWHFVWPFFDISVKMLKKLNNTLWFPENSIFFLNKYSTYPAHIFCFGSVFVMDERHNVVVVSRLLQRLEKSSNPACLKNPLMAQRKLSGGYLEKPVCFIQQPDCNYKEHSFRNTSGRFSISKQILFRDMDSNINEKKQCRYTSTTVQKRSLPIQVSISVLILVNL